MSTVEKLLLILVLGVAPAMFAFAVFALSFSRAERLSFCASCHTMTPWVADLENPNSTSLASKHYRNRWIVEKQCYTCHVNYEFMGPLAAKIDGMHHMLAYYTGIGVPQDTIKLYEPFPNANCLRCHGAAQNFNQSPTHAAVMEQVRANHLSCTVCHQPMHTPQG
jgi:nitrate/TMAO reductase-like tetraheme cytochrome c subunit